MVTPQFPGLDDASLVMTRNALHAYARVLGGWLKCCRTRRKHWWHASLRHSLNGLTTGVVHAGVDFEIGLNLRQSLLQVQTSTGEQLSETLHGQPASGLAGTIERFLVAHGVNAQHVPGNNDPGEGATAHGGYSAEHALTIAVALNSIVTAMEVFRAGIREETSPVQLWPHHFDLSLLWLPGEKIPGQDPANEEYADKQMNFGFTFGDEGIPEPYFYVTAYPQPDEFPGIPLPTGAVWHSEGFSGAVLPYRALLDSNDSQDCLLHLWGRLLSAGRVHMLAGAT